MTLKRILFEVLWGILSLLLVGFCLCSCDRNLDVQTAYPFEVSAMPVGKSIAKGETVEIRLNLSCEGSYADTRYTLRYFPYEGKGALRISKRGDVLQPNDRYPISKGDFRLYYTSLGTDRHSLELVFEDNHGQRQTMTFEFNNPQSIKQ